jgi:hypothetical protein
LEFVATFLISFRPRFDFNAAVLLSGSRAWKTFRGCGPNQNSLAEQAVNN